MTTTDTEPDPYSDDALTELRARTGSTTLTEIARLLLLFPQDERRAMYDQASEGTRVTDHAARVILYLRSAAASREVDAVFPRTTPEPAIGTDTGSTVTMTGEHFAYLMALARKGAAGAAASVLRNRHLDTIAAEAQFTNDVTPAPVDTVTVPVRYDTAGELAVGFARDISTTVLSGGELTAGGSRWGWFSSDRLAPNVIRARYIDGHAATATLRITVEVVGFRE